MIKAPKHCISLLTEEAHGLAFLMSAGAGALLLIGLGAYCCMRGLWCFGRGLDKAYSFISTTSSRKAAPRMRRAPISLRVSSHPASVPTAPVRNGPTRVQSSLSPLVSQATAPEVVIVMG